MATQIQTITDKQFTSGMNGQSPLDDIPDKYVEDLINMSVNEAGEVSGRPGSRTRAGLIPLRVSRIDYSTAAFNNITMTVAGDPNTFSLPSHAIILRGRSSAEGNPLNTGDLPNNVVSEIKYASFECSVTRDVAGNALATELISDVFSIPACVTRTSYAFRSSHTSRMESAVINQITNSAMIDLNGPATSTCSLFLVPAPVSSTCYHNASVTLAKNAAAQDISILQSVHNLVGTDFQVFCFVDNGASYTLVEPDSVVINNDGDVLVSVVQNFAASADIFVVIRQAEHVKFSILNTSGITTVSIEAFANPYSIATLYYRSGGAWHEVKPDTVAYDAPSRILTATALNLNGIPSSEIKLLVGAEPAVSDKIIVTGTQVAVGYTDLWPELDIYGIDAAACGAEYGHNKLLDAYRDAASETPITVQSRTPYIEHVSGADITGVSLYVTSDTGVSDITHVGPTFTQFTSLRSAGYISHPRLDGSLARAPRIVAANNGSTFEVILTLPDYTVVGAPVVPGDFLTMQNMTHAELNADHLITAVNYTDSSHISFTLAAPIGGTSSAWSIQQGGQVGLFTDRFTFEEPAPAPFITGDLLTIDNGEFGTMQVLGASGQIVLVKALNGVTIPTNQIIRASRTTEVIPLASNDFIEGDSVEVYSTTRKEYRQVIGSSSGADLAVTQVIGDGVFATAQVTGQHWRSFQVGKRILLLGAGEYSGGHTVTDFTYDGANTFVTFASTRTDTVSAIMAIRQSVIEVASVSVSDLDAVSCATRWHALEAPRSTSAARSPQAKSLPFDVDSALVSSGMNQNLYTVNQDNYPLALTDSGHRAAGLPAWNAIVSLRVEEAAGIDLPITTISTTGRDGSTFYVADGDEKKVLPADANNTERLYAVYNAGVQVGFVYILNSNTVGQIDVRLKSGSLGVNGAGVLKAAISVRYYARLRAIDENDNVIIGPTCGLDTTIVDLAGAATVNITLMEPPHVGPFSYSRGVWIDLFRTDGDPKTKGQLFYNIATLACTFETGKVYQEFRDVTAFDVATELDKESAAVTGSLFKGAPAFNQFLQPPPRCKTITTIGGYVACGNIVGDPSVELTIVNASSVTSAQLNGTEITLTDSAGNAQVFDLVADADLKVAITAATRAGDTVTLTHAGMPGTTADPIPGDWIFVGCTPMTTASGPSVSGPVGWFQVTAATPTTVTFTSHGIADDLTLGSFRVAKTSGHAPIPADSDPAWGNRGGSLSTSSGTASVVLNRIAIAISAVYANKNPSQSFMARALPRLHITSRYAGTIKVTGGTFSLALNGVLITRGQDYALSERVWPSRIALSGKNYPEVFAGFGGQIDDNTLGLIDVNPSDGDEIIALRPQFAESMYSAARQEQVLLVFKRRSIYAVNVDTFIKDGVANVQQIVAHGIGCLSPTGVAHMPNGVLFPAKATIYLLDKQMTAITEGEIIERQLTAAGYDTKTEFIARSSKDVYIMTDANVWVYKPDTEAWSAWVMPRKIETACSALGEFLMGCVGRVLHLSSDLSTDDSAPIYQQVTFRASGFGDISMLKTVGDVHLNIKTDEWLPGTAEALTAEYSTELRNSWKPCTSVPVKGPVSDDGVCSAEMSRRAVLKYACAAKKFQIMQVRVTLNSTQRLSISSINYKVAGIDTGGRGTKEASDQ